MNISIVVADDHSPACVSDLWILQTDIPTWLIFQFFALKYAKMGQTP